MSIPRIASAAAPAAAASSAARIPPALPRFPAGTWALITTGTASSSAAARASAALRASRARGVSSPAARSNGFAACSSKFILSDSLPGQSMKTPPPMLSETPVISLASPEVRKTKPAAMSSAV